MALRETWTPTYQTRRKTPFSLDLEIDECPRSFVTPEALRTIDDLDRAERLKAATGAVLFGTDSAQWPAIWADAVLVANHQRRLYEIALEQAETKDHKKDNG